MSAEHDWTPTHLHTDAAGALSVEWRSLGTLRLADPFFEDTVRRARSHPELGRLSRRTGLDALEQLAAEKPGIPPQGLIFHLSRCGSTLVSQMLAALPGAISISEAPPIDKVLEAPIDDALKLRWLRGLVSAFGQRRLGDERRLFVKLDAWHTLDLPLLARAFPGVPWVFVYRDPAEVLASHARQRGSHMVPQVVPPARLGLDPELHLRVPLDVYGAHVLAAIAEGALRAHAAGGGRLVAYSELPEIVCGALAEWFRLELDDADRARMHEVTRFHAKRPAEAFSAANEPPESAREALRQIAEPIAGEVYRRLEAARAGHAVAVTPAPARPTAVRAPALPSSLKLPLRCDAGGLERDLAGLASSEFVAHFNRGYYDRGWSAAPLRSLGGALDQIYPDPTRGDAFADTPLLARCPHVRAVLAELHCPVRAVRFLRLEAGASIKEHTDHDLGFGGTEVRLHIPVSTNERVSFVVGGVQVAMREGECWYHDFNLPHRVENLGERDRTHLVIDCVVNEWLSGLLLRAVKEI